MALSNSQWFASPGVDAGYEVDYSAWFSDSDASYIYRTMADGTPKKQTVALWFKLGKLATTRQLFQAGDGGTTSGEGGFWLWMEATDKLAVYFVNTAGATRLNADSNMLFRDPHAWYHLCVTWDTTPSSPVMKVFVNNEEITLDASDSIAQNDEFGLNSGSSTLTICKLDVPSPRYGDFYLSQMVVLDGTVVTSPSDGGIVEVDSNGVVRPADLTGLTFGDEGWLLDFADSSDLGNDVSGNNNDFTSSGLATSDRVIDTPTNNFPTFSPLSRFETTPKFTISNGNLDIDHTASNYATGWSSMETSDSGKYAFQFTIDGTVSGSNDGAVGFCYRPGDYGKCFASYGSPTAPYSVGVQFSGGEIFKNGTQIENPTGALADNDVIEILLDIDNGTCDIKKNGSAWGSQVTGLTAVPYTPGVAELYDIGVEFDFGQLSYTPSDSDYKTVCTNNLSVPTIADGSVHVQPHAYTGTGSAHTETLTGNSDLTSSDIVYIKNRDAADYGYIHNIIRTATKYVTAGEDDGEQTNANSVTSLGDSDAFTLGSGANGWNDSSEKFSSWVAYTDGTTGSSNSDGSRTSTVSANTTAGISLGTYTGNGSAVTVGHGLDSAPEWIIMANLTQGTEWNTYSMTSGLGWTKTFYQPGTSPSTSSNWWNNTAPTDDVFSAGTSNSVDGETFQFIAFHSVAGFSTQTSYTGNGAADGPLIITDFKPSVIWITKTSASALKQIDITVDTDNLATTQATIWGTTVHQDDQTDMDILSNGFKIRQANGSVNEDGVTYAVMAWAENPFGGHGGTFGSGVSPATAR